MDPTNASVEPEEGKKARAVRIIQQFAFYSLRGLVMVCVVFPALQQVETYSQLPIFVRVVMVLGVFVLSHISVDQFFNCITTWWRATKHARNT